MSQLVLNNFSVKVNQGVSGLNVSGSIMTFYKNICRASKKSLTLLFLSLFPDVNGDVNRNSGVATLLFVTPPPGRCTPKTNIESSPVWNIFCIFNEVRCEPN